MSKTTPAAPSAPTVSAAPFGVLANGDSVHVYTLTNANGIELRALDYGGVIQSLRTPGRDGKFADIVLGFDTLAQYVKLSPYFGAIVGRYANRIAKGKFTLDGKQYTLAVNNGPNALHGGLVGFDKVVWHAQPFHDDSSAGVVWSHTSPDGDQGYPGTMQLRVTYTLTNDNRLAIDYQATTDKPTIVNLTNHSYFNLAGAGSGDVLKQLMTIDADSVTPVDSTLIPTGKLEAVAGTPLDFRTPTPIGAHIADKNQQLKYAGGYDFNYVLNRTDTTSMVHAARAEDPASGRTLDVYTTQPGLQLYTGNFLDGSFAGIGGTYVHRGAFTFETQHYPDSPNHPNFPSVVLRPGQTYHQRTVFAFGVAK
ncbi:MAG: galactose mutarotase [Gemmatimonadota bacterium]|nr:galactose mutarotase [Gemmatimonadota bacterium]MDE3173310.1 galactose mutarotase [Gemmatimonadota bacterium]